jgi:hypothetical protein
MPNPNPSPTPTPEQVYVDDMQHALINLEVSLPTLLGAAAAEGRMVAGFTAATGKRYASHCTNPNPNPNPSPNPDPKP